MFNKPRKNFRTRQASEQSGDEKEEDDDVIFESFIPAHLQKSGDKTNKPRRKKKEKPEKDSKPKSVLSFADDEHVDAEEFKIKKSSHSRKMAKLLKRQARREQEEAELRQKEHVSGSNSEESAKAVKDSQNGLDPVDMDMGSDVESQDRSDEQRSEDGDIVYSSKSQRDKHDPFIDQKFRDMISDGHIPDATMIHMARKRRQQARERGGDFIPIEEDEARVEKKGTSRLVREDEYDCSDEDEERLEFSRSREQEVRKIQNTILAAEQGSNSEGSDHEREWEEQQIRKGVQAGVTSQGEIDDAAKQYQQFFFGNVPPSSYTNLPPANGDSIAPSIVTTRKAPPSNLPPITIDIIRKRLTDRLEELTSVHRAHVHELNDIESRMENCSLDINSQTGTKGGLENRYRFFQQMRGYVRDLIECLAEKMTSINFLDRCMMQQWKIRTEKLVKRRQQDVKDQAQDFMPHKAVITQPTMTNPDEDLARQRRTAEREARRARRRRAREAASVTDHHDGMSTDDEENKSDSAKYQMERGHTRSSVQTMFDDTVEDFCDANMIKARFEQWQEEQGSTYQEAYIALCLPKLFTPIIKLHLVEWNPFEDNAKNLEESPWFESLMFFGYKKGENPDDADMKLVPRIVEKVVLMKITALIENVWDPLSKKQNQRLVTFVQNLVQNYPTISSDSKNTQALMKAVVDRIRKCLDDDIFVPLYPKQVLENKSSNSSQFFHRQLWTCVKLLNNIMKWHGILSDAVLQQLGLDFLLNRYMVLALHNSPLNNDNLAKCQMITASFPSSWFTKLQSDNTIPQLENLCRHLVNAATNFGQIVVSCESDAVKYGPRENLKQIRKMLVTIHALDHASNLAEKFCIRS